MKIDKRKLKSNSCTNIFFSEAGENKYLALIRNDTAASMKELIEKTKQITKIAQK